MKFYSLLNCKKKKLYKKDPSNGNLDTNKVMKWKRAILQKKNRNKNHQIQSFYEEKIQITSFNSKFKRKKWIICCSYSLVVTTWWNRSGPANSQFIGGKEKYAEMKKRSPLEQMVEGYRESEKQSPLSLKVEG